MPTLPTTIEAPASPSAPTSDRLIATLETHASRVLAAAVLHPGQARGQSLRNTTGISLVLPGGSEQYPAMWVRDLAESCDCGLISAQTMEQHLQLIAQRQQGPQALKLRHGVIPAWSIPDHLLPDGSPVFFPGTYQSDDSAVDLDGHFGRLPPVDNHYCIVHLAWCWWRATQETRKLMDVVAGLTLWERLLRAFDAPEHDPATGLCTTTAELRAVNFGFYDTVTHTGSLLFASLLRRRAACELAALADALEQHELHRRFVLIANQIDRHIAPVFLRPDGYLAASTGRSAQADVWGSCVALTWDILEEPIANRVRDTLLRAVTQGTITNPTAAVRQVPTDAQFSDLTAWEFALGELGQYQNGGYWHTATGWLIRAIRPADEELAQQLAEQYHRHLQCADPAAVPWEWHAPDRQGHNPRYLTSLTCPLGSLLP